jgi:hypothetical protein
MEQEENYYGENNNEDNEKDDIEDDIYGDFSEEPIDLKSHSPATIIKGYAYIFDML